MGELASDRRRRLRAQRRRLGAVCLAALLSVALSAVARADDPLLPYEDPGKVIKGNDSTGQDLGGKADNDYTPVGKSGDAYWKQVAGAHYPDDHVPPDSPTPFDLDFHAVALGNKTQGFAGGTLHKDCGDRGTVDVPAIYEYRNTGHADDGWSPEYEAGCDEPGFVGAIAWVSNTGDALAVGGSGTYPDREKDRKGPTETSDHQWESDADWEKRDAAGEGRAWLYSPRTYGDRDFHEVDLSEQLAQGMRGMTALSFDPNPGQSFGFAGALGQIWQWQGGRFTTLYDKSSSATNMQGAPLFRYRVRKIVFMPGQPREAYAVTAGCCGPPAENFPRVLGYWGDPNKPAVASENNGRTVGPKWFVGSWAGDLTAGTADTSGQAPSSGQTNTTNYNLRQDMPDSFYSLTAVR
ncbi:MAG: hypothetical protein QOG26_1161, partial [Solirubrobacterales bacterium]|nr:hypothetical protein [Solirubrobacterales bacterium]